MVYEVSFRKRVLRCLEEGKSMVETAKLFGISVSSIKTWRKKQAAGNLADPIRKRPFKKIDPDAYLSELAEEFQCATSSIHEALVKFGFTRKKKSTKYREQDQKK